MPKRIVKDHKPNFETLKRAFESGHVCLMDCILKSTKEHVAVICAVQPVKGSEDVDTIPFAMFFNGNPYEMLISPLQSEYKEYKSTTHD